MKWMFIAVSLFLSLLPRSASAEALLVAGNATNDGGRVELPVAVLGGSGDKVQFSAQELIYDRPLAIDVAPMPVRLWLLVDASQLCQSNQVDAYIAELVARLRKNLHKDSRIAIASYASGSVVRVAAEQTVGQMESALVKCSPKMSASSYENALSVLLDGADEGALKKSGLKNVAWVFTSGSVNISTAMQQRLDQLGFSVHLVLYNSIMQKDIERVVGRMNGDSGDSRFRLSVLNKQGQSIPEQWFQVRTTVPAHVKKDVLSARISAKQLDKTMEPVAFSVGVDRSGLSFWEKYEEELILAFLILAGIGAVVGIVLFHRAKSCKECGKYLRHGSKVCSFCQKETSGYIVGKWQTFDRHQAGKMNVIALRRDDTRIGGKRGCEIRLPRECGTNRVVASIKRVRQSSNAIAYALVPKTGETVYVNGMVTEGLRLLGHGDVISIKGIEFEMFNEGVIHA